MKKTRIISFLTAAVMSVGMTVTAGAFSDMPDGEIGQAMQNAVDAGLINGVTDDIIAPNDNITRAQMAAIITRAFSCTEKSAAVFADVKDDAWYADAVSCSVHMGAFEGDDRNSFNPDNNITFQETYLVLSRVFGFEPYEVNGTMFKDCDISVLDAFVDKDQIVSWAVNGTKYIVGNGGWKGIDGKLKPTDYITRGEFALLMDSLVDVYIDKPGEYNNLEEGLIMVRCDGVKIDNLKSNKNLIVTYGVGEGGFEIKNSVINGVTLILGGKDLTPKEQQSSSGNTVKLPDNSYIKLEGNFYDVRVPVPYIFVNASNAKVKYYNGNPNSLVSLNFG